MMESTLYGHELNHLRQRRTPRRALDARVVLETRQGSLAAWSLNASDGGVRVLVIDDDRTLVAAALAGDRVTVRIDGWAARPGRIVWRELREGGAVLGIAFDGSTLPVDINPTRRSRAK
jgi:hypothetical protein